MNIIESVVEALGFPRQAREVCRESHELMAQIEAIRWQTLEFRLSLEVGTDNSRMIVERMRERRLKVPPFRLSHVGDWLRDYIEDWRPLEQKREAG